MRLFFWAPFKIWLHPYPPAELLFYFLVGKAVTFKI
jgi:hypothetical protein